MASINWNTSVVKNCLNEYIDKIYNTTGIGSYSHRLFDESHSPLAMWEKVKATLPDDSRTEEIKNYFPDYRVHFYNPSIWEKFF